MTKQKNLILDFINNSRIHPNANDIYESCKDILPNISLGTIYRNLNILVENGLIKRIKMPNHVDRYDRMECNHAHFICMKCGKIIDLDYKFEDKKENIDGNKVLDYEISFKGICKNCQNNKESELNGTKGK